MTVGNVIKLIDNKDYEYVFINVSDYVDLNACITFIGSATRTVVVNSPTTLSANLTIPSTIELIVNKSGSINIGSYNLIINGQFSCGLYRAFSGAGAVTIPTTRVPEVHPEWWGAVGDGVTDDTAAIQAAIDCWGSSWGTGISGGTVKFANATYAVTQIILKMSRAYVGQSTIIKALVSSTDSIIKTDGLCIGIVFKSIDILGINQGTQHGLYLDASGLNNWNTGGIWYSTFSDVQITGITGHAIHSTAQDVNSGGLDVANQFLTFNNVRAWRANTTTSRALYAVGQFGQIMFNNCEFDGAYPIIDNTVNVELALIPHVSPSDEVYSIDFNSCTFQSTDYGIIGTYANKVNFNGCHFEELKHSINFNISTIVVDKCFFANSANAGGTGYLVKPDAGTSLTFTNNVYSGITDKIIEGSSSYNIVSFGNTPKGLSIAIDDGYIPFSTGLTLQASTSVSGIMYVGGAKCILANGNGYDLKTIKSYLGEGETLCIMAWVTSPTNNILVINNTDNIMLPSYCKNGKLILHQYDCVTLMKNDLVGKWWVTGVTRVEKFSSAAPAGTDVTWERGDYIRNSAPSVGQPKGWICTVGGNPGTWVSEGNL